MHINNPKLYGALSTSILIAIVALVYFSSSTTPTVSSVSQSEQKWAYTNSFQFERRAFSAVAFNEHMYVIGGVNNQGEYVRPVEYAKIKPDGALGPWQITSALYDDRFYLDAVAINGFIYAIGGANGSLGDDNRPSASVSKAKILKEGSLGPWLKQAYLTTPRRGLRVVNTDTTIYALGGYNGSFLRTVERSTLLPNGDIESWQADQEESLVDRYIHSAAIHKNQIILLAGHVDKSDSMSYADVETATIKPNKTLTPWKIERSRLNQPRFIASATAFNNYIYIAGGHNGKNRINNVEFTSVSSRGTLGQWRNAAPLNTARSAAALVHYNKFIYMLGGSSNQGVTNTVEYAQQDKSGRLLLPSVEH